jgi:hypothetical protein
MNGVSRGAAAHRVDEEQCPPVPGGLEARIAPVAISFTARRADGLFQITAGQGDATPSPSGLAEPRAFLEAFSNAHAGLKNAGERSIAFGWQPQ